MVAVPVDFVDVSDVVLLPAVSTDDETTADTVTVASGISAVLDAVFDAVIVSSDIGAVVDVVFGSSIFPASVIFSYHSCTTVSYTV